MFKRKECRKCGKKISESYSYCPSCGSPMGKNEEDYGMFGKDDFEEFDSMQNNIFGGFGGKMLGNMLNSAMKMLEKEMQKEIKRAEKQPINKTNFELYINGKKINPENIKITQVPANKKQQIQKVDTTVSTRIFTKEQKEKFSKLPKTEPKTDVRRLSDEVIYEINLPGVKSIEDVSINKLENSIEIKALSKDKAYFKIIKINLQIKRYNLEKEKLVLKLDSSN